MASADVDLGQLSESQQLALQQFTSVTDQELGAAIPILRRSQWNVQVAIAKFFDGETADPVAEALASSRAPPPRQSSRAETLLNGSSAFDPPSTARGMDPAPRIVPQPDNQVAYRPPYILSLVFTPFNLLYRLLSSAFSLFGYLFPFLPRLLAPRSPGQGSSRRDTTGRRPLNPRDGASRFIREFEEEYGANSLPFFENGYAQALDKAKKDLKFLLVILLSPEHDDTSTFITQTLLSPEVTSFINAPENNLLLWAGSVQDSEAYQISTALRCTKFPFAALITHTPQISSTAMSVVARISGPTPPTAFIAKLQTAISANNEALARARNTRAEQEATRSLREEQNSAYERSLAQDRERARLKREAEAAKARAEQEARDQEEAAQRRARNLARWKRVRAAAIVPEPEADQKDVTRISVRMPDGERVVRRFDADRPMEELYAFVECYDVLQSSSNEKSDTAGAADSVLDEKSDTEAPDADFKHEYGFHLVSPMPRTVYDIQDGGLIREKVGRSGNLIVELIADEDEDEDDEEDV
ncbi:MAG: hypothetical protein M1819_000524 [Sarea resinae]|nr:MAG: hypothetical protein M1819_000524 [Sarea resinae]